MSTEAEESDDLEHDEQVESYEEEQSETTALAELKLVAPDPQRVIEDRKIRYGMHAKHASKALAILLLFVVLMIPCICFFCPGIWRG